MKKTIQKVISMLAIICLLTAFLTGCGSKEVTEVVQTTVPSNQEMSQDNEQKHQQGEHSMEKPENEPAQAEISEEDVLALIQAGLDAVAEESELWYVSEISDTEILKQLMQEQGGKEGPDGEALEGELPENMTSPEGEMPEGNSENPPENMDNMGEGGQAPDGDHQSGNRGGGMSALAIVIANAEGAAVAAEDVLAEIEAAAENFGYSTTIMEITEEQAALLEIPESYTGSRIVLVNAQMPEMETEETVG